MEDSKGTPRIILEVVNDDGRELPAVGLLDETGRNANFAILSENTRTTLAIGGKENPYHLGINADESGVFMNITPEVHDFTASWSLLSVGTKGFFAMISTKGETMYWPSPFPHVQGKEEKVSEEGE